MLKGIRLGREEEADEDASPTPFPALFAGLRGCSTSGGGNREMAILTGERDAKVLVGNRSNLVDATQLDLRETGFPRVPFRSK